MYDILQTGHYAHQLKLNTVGMFPFFSNPLPTGEEFHDIGGHEIVECLRRATLGLNERNSHQAMETSDELFDAFWIKGRPQGYSGNTSDLIITPSHMVTKK